MWCPEVANCTTPPKLLVYLCHQGCKETSSSVLKLGQLPTPPPSPVLRLPLQVPLPPSSGYNLEDSEEEEEVGAPGTGPPGATNQVLLQMRRNWVRLN